MASAAPPALPPGAHPSSGMNGDSSDWLELVRVFESMRVQMAKAEEKLKSERLANRQAEQHIEKERQSFAAEMAEQRRLLAEERREAEREREALEAEKRALGLQRQDLLRSSQESNATPASAKHSMPMRSPPLQSASSQAAAATTSAAPQPHSRVKAAPARAKEAAKPRGTAALDLPPPKAKARNPAPPVVVAASEASTAIGAADGGSCSSGGGRGDGAALSPVARDLEIEDVDALSDTPPAKPEEADEADRLALEDDAETMQQPAKAPPEPPIYWRHVKPPPKTSPDKADEERESEAEVKEESPKKVEAAKAPTKANPAWSSRPKGPPAMHEEEVGDDTPSADDGTVMAPPTAAPPTAAPGRPPPKASDSQQGFGVLKAPPARCPPKVKAAPSADCDEAPAPVPKSKVKAAPSVDRDDAPPPVPKSKVKAAPSGGDDAPASVPKSKVKAAPGKAKVKAPPGH